MSWKYFIKNYLSDTKGKCLAELCISIKRMSQFHSINVSVECRIQVQWNLLLLHNALNLELMTHPFPPLVLFIQFLKFGFLLQLKTAHGRHFLWSHDLTLLFHIHTFFGNSTQGSNFKQRNSPQANQDGSRAVPHRSQLFLFMGWTLSSPCEEKVFLQAKNNTADPAGHYNRLVPTKRLLRVSKKTKPAFSTHWSKRRWLLTCPWWWKAAKYF